MREAEEKLQQMIEPLLQWYQQKKRALPWRETKDPYAIWVSEIMLQQTRVEAVKPYYERFLNTLPTIRDLAEAEEDTLFKLWEGLGYYSRIRNMQKAAIQIMEDYGGVMPADYQALLTLKGIGPYTAGAVGSIAFSLPVPAVDGNVLRVLSRITANASDITLTETKRYWEAALREQMPKEVPGDLNQALMEIGAVICIPNGLPKCERCPIRTLCEAYRRNQTTQFPVKAAKKQRTLEKRTVFFCVQDGKVAIRKRPPKGLLSSLFELPNTMQEPFSFLQECGITEAEMTPMKGQKHIFTHVEWHMECYFLTVTKAEASDMLWLTPQEVNEGYALPSAFKKIWKEGVERMAEANKES